MSNILHIQHCHLLYMVSDFPAVSIHHLLDGPPSFLSLSLSLYDLPFIRAASSQGDRQKKKFSSSHMFRMLTRWAVFIAGFVVAAVSLALAKEVEFKHHNNTELAETLQKVHNR